MTTTSRRRPRWGLARVEGRSMGPALRPRDLLLLRYDPASLVVGEVVVARFADTTMAVKRVAEVRDRGSAGGPAYWLLSDDPDVGVDSRHRGAVARDAVVAVVKCRVWPPRRNQGLTMGLFRGV